MEEKRITIVWVLLLDVLCHKVIKKIKVDY